MFFLLAETSKHQKFNVVWNVEGKTLPTVATGVMQLSTTNVSNNYEKW